MLDPTIDWMADLEVGNDAEGFEIEIVEELFFDEVVDEGLPSTAAAARADDFVTLVGVLEETMIAQGAGPQAVACLRALLGIRRIEDLDFDEARTQVLVEGGFLVRTAEGTARSAALVKQVVAWQGILRGESEDFEGCADRSLDEWASDLVARVGGVAGRADSVRRELRRRGVAAFGFIAQAA